MFPFGQFFEKSLSIGTGQCTEKPYNWAMRDMIITGLA